ncbi:MAG: hypothetical protein HC860_20765, partial [Alkalinema sp. RU_4_3]|nr:hypothetical protein [Alkalinema sp. RU_4_3]
MSGDWQMMGLSALRLARLRELEPEGLRVPMTVLEPGAMGAWAKAVAAEPGAVAAGFLMGMEMGEGAIAPQELAPRDLVEQFLRTASRKAQELAEILALMPLNGSVIRLIQRNILEEPAALYLAEMVLSGLLEVVTGQEDQVYDFKPGVREALVRTIDREIAEDIEEEVAAELLRDVPQEILDRIDADVWQRFGRSLRTFEAFLVPDLDWGDVGERLRRLPFARVKEETLRLWGENGWADELMGGGS